MADETELYTLAEEIPDTRFAPLPEAGHNPMWDRPEDFSRLVLNFLATGQRPIERARRAPLALGA